MEIIPPLEHNTARKFWTTLRLNLREPEIYRKIAVEGSETFPLPV